MDNNQIDLLESFTNQNEEFSKKFLEDYLKSKNVDKNKIRDLNETIKILLIVYKLKPYPKSSDPNLWIKQIADKLPNVIFFRFEKKKNNLIMANSSKGAYPTPEKKGKAINYTYGNNKTSMAIYLHDGNREIYLSAEKMINIGTEIIKNNNIKKTKFILPFSNKVRVNIGSGTRYLSKYCKIKISNNVLDSDDSQVLLVVAFYDLDPQNPNSYIYSEIDSFGIVLPYKLLTECLNRIHPTQRLSDEIEIGDDNFKFDE